MAFTVSQVARLSGVSVRALHHYDEIGLLQPSGRSASGYRLYDDADLERLQQILFFRELEFPLPRSSGSWATRASISGLPCRCSGRC